MELGMDDDGRGELRGVPRLHDRPTVLLFYDGFELHLRPGLAGQAGARLRGMARSVYRRARRRQVWTGFYTAFQSLVVSLRRYGCDVRVNALDLAAKHPNYPIGIAGYPTVLTAADVPNPRVFGPGDWGYPDVAVAKDPRNRILTQPSEWPVAFYRASCGDRLRVMFVGIDTDAWPDLSNRDKDLDLIVYDKIRWIGDAVRRDETPDSVRQAIAALDRRGLRYVVLRYGAHHASQFRAALSRARGMLFLCEHETQGLAYQEALASNVSVLALDDGVLVDPDQKRYAPPGLKVCSVPYFDARCGETFALEQLDATLDQFMTKLPCYRPRDFVLDRLSMRRAAANYLSLYASLA
jgi:hypothetical protein